MKAFLLGQKHKDVVEFYFDKEDQTKLEWEGHTEFRYNGDMYDVIDQKTDGDKVFVRCIADKNETALLHAYQKEHKQGSNESLISHLITAQFVLPADNRLAKPEKLIQKIFSEHSTVLTEGPSFVLSPPPDVC